MKHWKWMVLALLLAAALAACGKKTEEIPDVPAPAEEESPPEEQPPEDASDGEESSDQEEDNTDDEEDADETAFTLLTEKELAEFGDYFNAAEHNGLLRFPYQDASEAALYLDILFYDDSGSVADMTAEELAAVENAGVFTELDMRKLTCDYVLDYLQGNFGIGYAEAEEILAESGDRLGTYLPDYDAYYSCRGDTAMQEYTFTIGCRFLDGSVQLCYTAGALHCGRELAAEEEIRLDIPMYVLLRSDGSGGWYVIRNTQDRSD